MSSTQKRVSSAHRLLLGLDLDGTLEVSNSFPIPHHANDDDDKSTKGVGHPLPNTSAPSSPDKSCTSPRPSSSSPLPSRHSRAPTSPVRRTTTPSRTALPSLRPRRSLASSPRRSAGAPTRAAKCAPAAGCYLVRILFHISYYRSRHNSVNLFFFLLNYSQQNAL